MTDDWSFEELLRGIPFFSALPQEEIQSLTATTHLRDLPAGSVLFREGDTGDRFFILTQGEIEVVKFLETPDERRLSIIGPGDILGEMSLFYPDRQRSASARAMTQTQALEMTHADFETLLQRQPDLAFHMMREMTVRMRNTELVTIRELQERNLQLAQAVSGPESRPGAADRTREERIRACPGSPHSARHPAGEYPIPTGLAPHHALAASLCRRWGFLRFHSISDGSLGIVIGDATGKGVPAALVMATTCSILRAIAASLPPEKAVSPGEFLCRSNELLCRQVPARDVCHLLAGCARPG